VREVDAGFFAEHPDRGDSLARSLKAVGVDGLVVYAGEAQLAFEVCVVRR
jgi:hypothetical protein